MMASTINPSRQLIVIMKYVEVMIFRLPQTMSKNPQVTSWATRSESELTRDISQPTGVLL